MSSPPRPVPPFPSPDGRRAAGSDPIPDRELLRQAQHGDRRAAGALTSRYRKQVGAWCRKWLPNPADVEDAVQEIFLRFLSHLGRVDQSRRLGGWLHRITTNHCIDVLRHHSRAPSRQPLPGEPHGRSPEQEMIAAQTHAELVGLLAELTPRDAALLIDRHVREISVDDIARKRGLATTSTHTALTRARRRLRRAAAAVQLLVCLLVV